MAPRQVLCVAEKPSIAKDLAAMLSRNTVRLPAAPLPCFARARFPLLLGSCSSATLHASPFPPDSSSRPAHFCFHVLSCHCQQAQSHRTYSQYNAKFEFSYTFEGQPCNFVMTSVLGHLFSTDFVERCATCLFPRTCSRANCFWPCAWPRSFTTVRSSFSNAPLAHGISFIRSLLFCVVPSPFYVTCNTITLLCVLSPHFLFFFAPTATGSGMQWNP